MSNNEGFYSYSDDDSDNSDDTISYLDENYENDYTNDHLNDNLQDNFADLDTDQLTKDFNNIIRSLEKYESDPTENIKILHNAFNYVYKNSQHIIKSSLLLQTLSLKVKDRLELCDRLFDDMQYAKNCEKEMENEITNIPTKKILPHKIILPVNEIPRRKPQEPLNNNKQSLSGDPHIDKQVAEYRKFLDRL